MTYRFVFLIASLLIAQMSCAQLFGEQQIITTQADEGRDCSAADLDGDGDLDVLSASFRDDKIAWYENLGEGQIGSQQIISTQGDGLHGLHTADLDGDGDMDVLSTSLLDDEISWYENLGGGNFGTQLIISSQLNNPIPIYAADLDGDGDLDVISASTSNNKIVWYENLGGGSFDSQLIISTQVEEPRSVQASDLDGDGDMDVLSASYDDDKIAWYENLGEGNFGSQQIISMQLDGAIDVYPIDLDGDGDFDVLSASYNDNKIAWYENLGGGLFGAQQIISLQADSANTVLAADLDGDGDLDVLSASNGDSKIAWYENLSEGLFGIQQVISTQALHVWSINTADLDGDGDVDVLSASIQDDKIAWYENLRGEGCTDPSACNYEPEAYIENGSCCNISCGCTNPIAVNYLESATCDNSTCFFRITGTVFFDENENGFMDANEYGLPFQTVVIEELGQTYITNDEGNFIAMIGQEQIALLELINTDVFPYNTTINPQLFDAETAESANFIFGVSNQEPDFAVCVDLYPNGNGFLCNVYANHSICFRNMGNVPIDGVLELEYDELFQGHQEVTPIDSVNGNTVYMSFENLLPGQMFFYDIDLLTPTVDHIGEFVTSYARIYGYYEGEQVAYGEKELTMQITCAYDPNDKQAFPLGYTDDHWLLPETEQEFLVRFQNTGNAPAQNIRIQDTLDVNFDIESFRLIANSHSVMTTINPETRLIDFYFENIQLPDSVNNEPASHGLISYKITPLPNLPVGTVLENTAYIYFDNNDPIITNTTWTTIHECGGEADFIVESFMTCEGLVASLTSQYPFVENYNWTLDGAPISTESSFEVTFPELGEYDVLLEASNPLCTDINTTIVSIESLPEVNFCPGDFNCDGYRGVSDLNALLTGFGCTSDCEIDVNNDGVTTVMDFIVFLSVFGVNCLE